MSEINILEYLNNREEELLKKMPKSRTLEIKSFNRETHQELIRLIREEVRKHTPKPFWEPSESIGSFTDGKRHFGKEIKKLLKSIEDNLNSNNVYYK